MVKESFGRAARVVAESVAVQSGGQFYVYVLLCHFRDPSWLVVSSFHWENYCTTTTTSMKTAFVFEVEEWCQFWWSMVITIHKKSTSSKQVTSGCLRVFDVFDGVGRARCAESGRLWCELCGQPGGVLPGSRQVGSSNHRLPRTKINGWFKGNLWMCFETCHMRPLL